MRISKFGAQPRVKTRPDNCETHGPFDRKLIEAFDGDNRVLGCPNCHWEALNTAAVDSEAHKQAADLKRWRSLNARLFATGIALRFRPCSLDNYLTRLPGQAQALAVCQAYVDQFEECLDAGRCLLMLGNFGNGKTHLGCAILKSVVTRYGATALYAPAPDIIAALKASFAKGSEDTEQSILADLSAVDLLLIDELGAQGGTEFERHSLHTIIDTRYRNMLPTIITSNLPSSELSDYIGDRALDRLRQNGGEAIAFTWESHRGGEA
ncbi:ATP-binding protein [Pseudomonas massiliensis]|uniref:ATP-binding protein n=1 Tax=Pseudomonas massiliensis TaxID=522492 RepID=UPI00058EF169|nr:ATP-binding protein [Pseudomonas massiliensis]